MDVKKISGWERFGFAIGLVLLLLFGSKATDSYARTVLGNSSLKRYAAVVKLEGENPNSIDVLTIGDSESYTTVSPMQIWNDLGYATYVGGQGGQTMNEMLTMLEAGLKNQKPQVVLMETNALYRSSNDLEQLQELVATRAASVFPIFQYHNLWKNGILKPSLDPVDNNKGFHINDGIKAYTGSCDYMETTKAEAGISWFNLKIFDRIVELCKENGARLVLYSGPSPVNYSMKKHNRLERLAKENELIYIDMNLKNTEIGIDWSKDTYDAGDHLNISGTQKTTAFLEGVLQKFDLQDRRQDPGYAEWNTLVSQYNQHAAKAIEKIRGKAK